MALISMRSLRPRLAVFGLLAGLVGFGLGLSVNSISGGQAAAVTSKRTHRIVFQVNTNDVVPMQHAIANADNAMKLFASRGEKTEIEIVTYGPGIHMFRDDTSPVKPALHYLHTTYPDIVFSVCGNTKALMEAKEGHTLSFVDGARVVPAGIARIVELEEAGWSYVRP